MYVSSVRSKTRSADVFIGIVFLLLRRMNSVGISLSFNVACVFHSLFFFLVLHPRIDYVSSIVVPTYCFFSTYLYI